MDFPGAQLVNNLAAIQQTPVQFLGQEDPLKKGYKFLRSRAPRRAGLSLKHLGLHKSKSPHSLRIFACCKGIS